MTSMTNKSYGLFFIHEDKSVFYKAYYTVDDLVAAVKTDNEFLELRQQLGFTEIQVILLNENKDENNKTEES